MNLQRVLLGALSLAAAGLAACGGATGVLKGACASVAPPALLYPASSTTGVPDGNLDIWVGYPENPSTAFSAPALTSPGIASVNGTAWLPPSPGPTNPPGLLTLPANDQYWTSGILALAPSTTYTVTVTNTLCNQTFSLGSFTTQ
ncbi:MAG TPA: hypothetical protein VGZ02_06030 [Candidatus Baltobacteraceae bacterium]|jgi:hypothetical protein|nr:hypothetical protein [Candidatus Baltobacteraceae bacterium]